MNTLIVGGSSGLGLEIAKIYSQHGPVIVTGRKNPGIPGVEFHRLDLTEPEQPKRIDNFIHQLVQVDTMVFSAGLYIDGSITDLTEQNIEDTLDISARGLIYFTKSILQKQGKLGQLVTITSMSQWTPTPTKPVYNFVKAGMGIFSNALAKDGRIGKVLVVGPSTMADEADNPKYAAKKWVAEQIEKISRESFSYKCVRILNNPVRIEEVEKR